MQGNRLRLTSRDSLAASEHTKRGRLALSLEGARRVLCGWEWLRRATIKTPTPCSAPSPERPHSCQCNQPLASPTMCPDPRETLVLLEPRPFSAVFQLPFLQHSFVCVETEHAPWPWRFRRLSSQHRFPPRLIAADGRVSKFCGNLALIAPEFALCANRCFHLGTRNEKIMRYTAGEHPRTSNKTENREENRKIHRNGVLLMHPNKESSSHLPEPRVRKNPSAPCLDRRRRGQARSQTAGLSVRGILYSQNGGAPKRHVPPIRSSGAA